MPRKHKRPVVLIGSSQKALRVPRRRITELVGFVARVEGAEIAEIDLAVVGSDQIAALNRRYLQRRGATDVLSFDLSESPAAGIRGQIVVCGERAAAEARLRKGGRQRELMLYVLHGLLHLMGYDDATVRGAARMHAREEQLLRDFLQRTRDRS